MSGTDALETALRLLFLIAYTLAAAGLLLPLFSRRASRSRTAKASGRFLQLLTVTGIIPSLQVILDAFGIIGSLPKPWQPVLTLVFNNLILLALGGLVFAWESLARSVSPAPFPTDIAGRPAGTAAAAVLMVNIALQTSALLTRIPAVQNAARYGLIVLFVLLSIIVANSTVRILRRNNRDGAAPGSIAIRLIPAVFLVVIVIHSLGSGPWRSLLPPSALIVLITMSMAVFIKASAETETPNLARDRLFDDAGVTKREREIALMLAEGLSYKEISGRLFISLSTMQTHVSRIYGKMGVNSKTELSLKLGGRSAGDD